MGQGYEQTIYTDERIQMADKHYERTLIVVREMQNKATINTIFTHQLDKNER